MFRKLLSKITQTLKGGSKRTETARPAHPAKSGRAGSRDRHPRHEKKGGPAAAPRPTSASAHSPKPAHAAPKAAAASAPKPLPEVPKLDTSFTALGLGDRVVGVCTSGAYGHATGKSLTFAYVAPGATEGLEVVILGERHKLGLLPAPVWDPTNARQRA